MGAIGGPLLAIGLVALVGVRAAIGLSVIPGLLAALAIIYAIRHTTATRQRTSQPIRIRIRPVLRGRLGRLMIGVAAFELGNAATLLILRATALFQPGRSQGRRHPARPRPVRAVQPRRDGDQRPGRVARGPLQPRPGAGRRASLLRRRIRRLRCRSRPALPAGHRLRPRRFGIGCGETAQSAAVATLAPAHLCGSAFGLLATVQAGANLAASAIAGILWTAVSPVAAFLFLAAAMITAVP